MRIFSPFLRHFPVIGWLWWQWKKKLWKDSWNLKIILTIHDGHIDIISCISHHNNSMDIESHMHRQWIRHCNCTFHRRCSCRLYISQRKSIRKFSCHPCRSPRSRDNRTESFVFLLHSNTANMREHENTKESELCNFFNDFFLTRTQSHLDSNHFPSFIIEVRRCWIHCFSVTRINFRLTKIKLFLKISQIL